MNSLQKIVCIIFIMLFNWSNIFSQVNLLSNDHDIVNKIDSLGDSVWIVQYQYSDLIDSVLFMKKENRGIIKSYNTSNQLIREEIFQHDSLASPRIMIYESLKYPGSGKKIEENRYFGRNVSFQDQYLVLRIKYYLSSTNNIKSSEQFAYLLCNQIVAKINPNDYSIKYDTVLMWHNVLNGFSFRYNLNGEVISKEKYVCGSKEDK